MSELWTESWFWPIVGVVVGLPVVLLVLGEVHASMVRHERNGAGLVALARNVLAPLVALLVLFSLIPKNTGGGDFPWAKLAATAVGVVVILLALNTVNVVVFTRARAGTWRQRFPSIFVDLARVVLVVVGLALLFGWVWDADVGGIFAALGVGSIVVGLALQNAVGGVISGLLLLFEQPFAIGDYLTTAQGRGRVDSINWRAIHLDTGNGILVIPNAELAGGAFRNLSRASSPYSASAVVRFATDDPPQTVIDVLVEVASGLPERAADDTPSAIPLDKSKYEVSIPLTSPGKEYGTVGTFRTRLWYAARRAGLHLEGDLSDPFTSPERTLAAVRDLASTLRLTPIQATELAPLLRLERYGRGEAVQTAGRIPDAMRVIVSGAVSLTLNAAAGVRIPVAQLTRGDLLGLTALTRQAVAVSAMAVADLAVLVIPLDALETLVDQHPALARDIGAEIDVRRTRGLEAAKQAGASVPLALVIA